MVRRQQALLGGFAAALLASVLIAPWQVAAQSNERSITLYNIHTKETVTAVFKRNGKFVEAGLEKLNQAMRDHRRNEATKMDPELIDLLWQVHNELGSREPIHLISGFRSRATNDQLRKTNGGQASESRHILGKAADVHFPDVPVKKLRYSGLIQERGGVGYYPTSAIPFVHLDTDRVRSWPRLPRHELALLFPSGSTQHAPAEGGPLTSEDVRVAKSRYGELAQQIAAFHVERRNGGAAVAVADVRPALNPTGVTPAFVALPKRSAQPVLLPNPQIASQPNSQPSLQEAPRQVARLHPTMLPGPQPMPSASDRAKLFELASLASAPQLVVGPQPARRPTPKPQVLEGSAGGLPVPVDPIAEQLAREPSRQVAALTPPRSLGETLIDAGRFGWGSWIPAPAYDEEHPEELSYRPFPILPYLTDAASQPLMHELVAHDVSQTVELLDQPDTAATLRFRPGQQAATRLWELHFTGPALGIDKLRDSEAPEVKLGGGLKSRAVKTVGR